MKEEQHNEEPTVVVRPPHSTAPEVERLFEILDATAVLEVVTDEQIAKTIGESRGSPRFFNITGRAVKRLRTEKNIVYKRIRKTGYKREDSRGRQTLRHPKTPLLQTATARG
jgi:hypothetical protein